MTKILVIEDQEGPWNFFHDLLIEMCGIPAENIQRARWYTEAQKMITENNYDIILLDHCMPHDDPHSVDADLNKLSPACGPYGYGLLPFIREKQPQATTIGTSSLDQEDLRGCEQPALVIRKMEMFDKLPDMIRPLIEVA